MFLRWSDADDFALGKGCPHTDTVDLGLYLSMGTMGSNVFKENGAVDP